MNGIDKLFMVMQSEGAKGNTPGLTLATMTAAKKCSISGIEFDADELLFSSHIVNSLQSGDTVVCYPISDDKYLILAKVVSG